MNRPGGYETPKERRGIPGRKSHSAVRSGGDDCNRSGELHLAHSSATADAKPICGHRRGVGTNYGTTAATSRGTGSRSGGAKGSDEGNTVYSFASAGIWRQR